MNVARHDKSVGNSDRFNGEYSCESKAFINIYIYTCYRLAIYYINSYTHTYCNLLAIGSFLHVLTHDPIAILDYHL